VVRINPDTIRQPAFVLAEMYKPGRSVWHTHRRAQLAYVSDGVLTVRTEQGLWVVPPQRAVWVLPGVRHNASSAGPYSLCTLYIEPKLVKLPPRCSVVTIEPLVRELLVAAGRFGHRYQKGSAEARLIRVVLDRLPTLPITSLSLPEPSDQRLRRITRVLQAQPSDARPLPQLSRACGMSYRTVERLFHRELGLTFREWRRHLRLLTALERLAAGESVTNVAMDVGYADVSAFIAMFKSALGLTPGQYFRPNAQCLPITQ
jgi:AraC-like DNA-binding protein